MKRLEDTPKNGAENIDYVDVGPSGNMPRPRKRRALTSPVMRWAMSLFVLLMLGYAGYTYHRTVLEPKQDADAVEAALASLKPAEREYLAAWARAWTPEQRIITTAKLLLNHEGAEATEVRQQGFESLMRQAIRIDSIEAHLLWGEALRDGSLLKKDPTSALRHFREAQQKLAEPLLAGDPDALWLQAEATIKGLGVQVDAAKAVQLAERAAQSLRSWRAGELASALGFGRPPFDRKNESLAQEVLNRAWSAGVQSVATHGNTLCVFKGMTPIASLEGVEADKATQHLSDQVSRLERERLACSESWLRRSAEVQAPYAASEYGSFLITQKGELSAGMTWMAKGVLEANSSERLVFNLARAATEQRGSSEAVEALRALVATEARETASTDPSSLISWPLWHRMGVASTLTPGQWRRLGVAMRQAVPEELTAALSQRLEQDARFTRHLAPVLAGWREGGNAPARWEVESEGAIPSLALRSARSTKGQDKLNEEDSNSASHRTQAAPRVDPDQQEATGYVRGAPKLALGGKSTFLVDNTQGGGDALVRLYRDGAKPAVRSFFVKQGEKFTATELRPGQYVMRYRYMGSTRTFQADEVFDLKQIEELDGVRVSNVRVTLYRVRDGNMKTKEVAPDDF
ncbi:MAG: hypothetical protein J0L58_10140 [Burkholderiales bacterium]|nr:hypothetical protein [Burkholderiales bacterium]